MRYGVLLRGINVGGARRIGMAELRDAVASAGLGNPVTVLNSGNLVGDFAGDAAAVAALVEDAITTSFGLAVDTVVVPRDDLGAIVAACPFGTGRNAQIAFCRPQPTTDQVAAARRLAAKEEGVRAGEGVLYLNLPYGVASSKLAQGLPRALRPTVVTVRTAATVQRLLGV